MPEHAPRRSWRIAAGALIAVGIVAGLLALLAFFAGVTSHGVDCGSILSPKDPPADTTDPAELLAGCGGARAERIVVVLGGGALAVACTIGGRSVRRRG